jgi:KDO2-lipid IV(A) lauroyltransferase
LLKAGRRRVFQLTGERLFVGFQRSFENKRPVEAERSGEKVGLLWYVLDPKHRKRALSNLGMAFPERGETEIRSLAKDVFRHVGRIAGDFMRSPARTHQDVLENMEVEGLEHLEEVEARGKGGLLITGHFGNWERAAHWVVAAGRPLSVVARDADQRGVQARVLRIREGTGVEVMSRGNTARQALVRLRNKELIGILADQNSYDSFVPFFGYPCGTVSGPAVLHRRTGAPLCPVYCVWEGYNRYRVIALPLVDPNNEEENIDILTARLNQVLESVIRQYPNQWLWMHDRWKAARRRGLL